jgi:hypothetical protein
VQVASPADGGRYPSDPARALQHSLYPAVKADPGRRFHAPGIDRITLEEVEQALDPSPGGVTDAAGDPLEPGYYMVRATMDDRTESTLLWVDD